MSDLLPLVTMVGCGGMIDEWKIGRGVQLWIRKEREEQAAVCLKDASFPGMLAGQLWHLLSAAKNVQLTL